MDEVEHVHPQRASLQLVRHADSPLVIFRVDSRGETIGRVVSLSDNLLLISELVHGDHGSEDLLLDDSHAGLHVREDGRLDPVAVAAVSVTVSLSSESDGSALLLADVEVGFDLVVLDLAVLRALVRGLIEVVADLDFLHTGGEEFAELIVDVVVDVDSGAGVAGLAVVPGGCQYVVLQSVFVRS